MWGNIGYRHSTYFRFMNLVGFTYGEHNPDSWEGWHWGATHMWGQSHRLGLPEQYDLLEDALKNAEMIVFWSADPEATCGGIYAAFESTPRRQWLKELGVKMVVIDPYFNHTAGLDRRQVVRSPPGHRCRRGPGHRLRVADRGHLRQGVRGRPHGGLRRSGRTTCWAPARRRRRQDAGMGRGRIRRARPRDPGAGPGVGGKKDHGRSRQQPRHGRRLPLGHGQRVDPGHGRPGRHAGHGQAGQQHLGDYHRDARRLLRSSWTATPRAASPATWTTPPPASAGSIACSRRAARPAPPTTPPKGSSSTACASPKP